MSEFDLNIFTDEDGLPWAAFVWGNINVQIVAAMITPAAIEEATGFADANLRGDEISWPPCVQAYWMRQVRDGYPDDGDTWVFCAEGDEGAERITGHRFYPQ